MNKAIHFSWMVWAVVLLSCNQGPSAATEKTEVRTPAPEAAPTNQVLHGSQIEWEQLNPARGDQSPQAGTVWGDRKGEVATGFLAKFVDGFSSPPHIHNVTYRAVVLKGAIHNNDAAAKEMWMPPGSFWTQPKGQAHITSAKGEECVAYVEIDSGPYLVKPTNEAFESAEQPINVDASNIVWLDNSQTRWIENDCSAEMSFLWEGQNGTGVYGAFVKMPQNSQAKLHSKGDVFKAIVVCGEVQYRLPQTGEVSSLDAGSSFSATSDAVHSLQNDRQEEVLFYVRASGPFSIGSAD